MRKILVAFAVLGTFAMVANANDLTIYFGRPETVPPTTSFVGGADPTPLSSQYTAGPVTLGIWANVQCDISDPSYPTMDTWNGIAIDIVGATVSGLTLDNFDHRVGPSGVIQRWETTSDFGGGDNGFYLVSVTQNGLGGALYPREFGYGNGATDWWTYTSGTAGEAGAIYRYWLGNVTLSATAPAEVKFQIGTGGISRAGGTTADWIYFGEGEAAGLHGNQFGEVSATADYTFTIPEPASLILLSLAGLFLRRR